MFIAYKDQYRSVASIESTDVSQKSIVSSWRVLVQMVCCCVFTGCLWRRCSVAGFSLLTINGERMEREVSSSRMVPLVNKEVFSWTLIFICVSSPLHSSFSLSRALHEPRHPLLQGWFERHLHSLLCRYLVCRGQGLGGSSFIFYDWLSCQDTSPQSNRFF